MTMLPSLNTAILYMQITITTRFILQQLSQLNPYLRTFATIIAKRTVMASWRKLSQTKSVAIEKNSVYKEHLSQHKKSGYILEYLVYATKTDSPALASTAAGATNEP